MKNIVILGDTGFIGRHLVRRLTSNEDYTVVGYSRAPTFSGKYFKHYSQDILDLDTLLTEFTQTKNKLDAIVYLVGLTKHEDIAGKKDLMLRLHTQGVLNALRLAEITDCKKFIYLSSGKVYGNSSEDGILDESCKTHPTTFLGTCKKMAEDILMNICLPGTIIARLFNAYGPRQSENYLVSKVIKNAIETGEVDLETLEPIRDYVYVKDVCSAIEVFLENPTYTFQFANISTGIGTSVGNIVRHVSKILNKEIKVVNSKKKRYGETPVEIGILSKYLTSNGWKPRSVEEGLKLTIEEFQKCKNLKS